MLPQAPRALALVLVLTAGLAAVRADEVSAGAIAFFERYVTATEARMQRDRNSERLLWLDGQPAVDRSAIDRRLRRGEVVTHALRTPGGGTPPRWAEAVFLHSVAIVFLPDTTRDATVAMLQDFDHHAELFGPTIRRSRVVGHEGDATVVAGQFAHRKVVQIVYNAEMTSRCDVISARQTDCRSVSRRGAMVTDAGKPTEREKGFRGDPRKQWFLRSYYRVQERDGGTYLEHETLFVCPPLPFVVRVFSPLVRDVPADVSRSILAALRLRLSRG